MNKPVSLLPVTFPTRCPQPTCCGCELAIRRGELINSVYLRLPSWWVLLLSCRPRLKTLYLKGRDLRLQFLNRPWEIGVKQTGTHHFYSVSLFQTFVHQPAWSPLPRNFGTGWNPCLKISVQVGIPASKHLCISWNPSIQVVIPASKYLYSLPHDICTGWAMSLFQTSVHRPGANASSIRRYGNVLT